MKCHETLAAGTVLLSLAGFTGCGENGRDTPPPKPPPQTTTASQAAAATRPSATTMPFAIEPHSGMMMPPGHPPVGAERGTTAQPPAGKPLRFTAPSNWIPETPTSTMRVAQYRVPRAADDPEDGLLVVSSFPEMRGMTQMNIDRWISQFAQPESRPAKEAAKVATTDVAGMKTTILRITGTYEGRPGWAMCAADIEAPGGPWFVKMTGPEKTIRENDAAFDAFVKSARK